ncbi:hypothetical protein [Comamonas sp.]|uniref:hypothetical protein n=1 Tax=Comamonas sp. TaxID=34028 RepID=UPI0028A2643B|nr:hypothetical protein [Comamonas sp.]
MATPNYGYEKRQRELAKKNKKADKLREKAERKVNPQPSTGDDVEAVQPPLPTTPPVPE